MLNIWQTVKSFLYIYFRCIVKWFLRKTTKLCELQRICYSNNCQSIVAKSVEYSIINSHSKVLNRIECELSRLAVNQLISNKWQLFEKAIEATLIDKKINVQIHTDFIPSYRVCLVQIYGYKQLVSQISAIQSTSYDKNNEKHKEMLRKLWTQLKDEPFVGYISKEWSEIGFQGEDPTTDLRGMGLLGLENILYFADNYRESARHLLQHSLHPIHGYPMAIVGINLTHLAVNLLTSGRLKTHFYNLYNRLFKVEDFHKVYCYIFVEFDKLWLTSRPQSVMEFSHIRDKFEVLLNNKLNNENTIFKWDPHIETL